MVSAAQGPSLASAPMKHHGPSSDSSFGKNVPAVPAPAPALCKMTGFDGTGSGHPKSRCNLSQNPLPARHCTSTTRMQIITGIYHHAMTPYKYITGIYATGTVSRIHRYGQFTDNIGLCTMSIVIIRNDQHASKVIKHCMYNPKRD